QLSKAAISGRLNAWANALIGVSAALILGYGSSLVLSGELTRGQLIAFYSLAAFLFPPMRRLANINEVYQESMVSLERIFKFLDSTSGAIERPGAFVYSPRGGAVSFCGVTYSYRQEKQALCGIDLDVAPGEV